MLDYFLNELVNILKTKNCDQFPELHVIWVLRRVKPIHQQLYVQVLKMRISRWMVSDWPKMPRTTEMQLHQPLAMVVL